MSDLIVIQPQVTELTVTEDVNQVVVSSVGVQGPAGATGATGATGAKGDTGDQGPSGVVAVTAPITNSGTSTSANIGVSAGSTSTAGVLQLTDSTSSTSTTTAATPNAVKTAYDYADTKTPIMITPSGQYVQSPSVSYSNVTATVNRSNCMPIYLPATTSFDRLAVMTSGTFSGTAVVRMGIYAHDVSTGKPSTLILDAGTVSCTAINTIYQITISQTLTAGFYWLVMNVQTGATSNGFIGSTSGLGNVNYLIPYRTSPSLSFLTGWAENSVTGAFANAGSLIAQGSAPYTWARTV